MDEPFHIGVDIGAGARRGDATLDLAQPPLELAAVTAGYDALAEAVGANGRTLIADVLAGAVTGGAGFGGHVDSVDRNRDFDNRVSAIYSRFNKSEMKIPYAVSKRAEAAYMSRWIEKWEPENPTFWEATGKKIARRNLVWSILAENIG